MGNGGAIYGNPQSMLVGAVFDAWADLDRAIAGLAPEAALRRWEDGQGSSIAWTLAHVTELVDSWINVRFQGRSADPLIGQGQFRAGGSGDAAEWTAVLGAVAAVRASAASFLAPLTDEQLLVAIPYSGSVRGVREHGRLPLRYALLRIVAHSYVHLGEIELKRRQSGTPTTGDFPGQLDAALRADQ